jgi:hypothetical protein
MNGERMSEWISARLAKLAAPMLVAVGCLVMATGASASEVAYNNLNTVPATVNGQPNEDTYSLDYENFEVGGQVGLASTAGHVAKSLTTQLDNFTCEHGVYTLENCYTLKPNKKMSQSWIANIYSVGAGNSVGTLLSSSTATFKLHYRPTTNVSCPATSEGKGFGANCDVGGVLQTVTFKHFSPAATLPSQVIILLKSSCGGSCGGQVVNAGLQASFKEYSGGNFVEEPAANGGVPAVGSDPLPEDIYTNATLNAGGWEGYQPVFELSVSKH